MTDHAPLAGRVRLGRTELAVAPLCLGGNVFGWTADREAAFAVLDAYAASGGNFIDTADSYSWWVEGNTGGESETIIGQWMESRGNRDDMVIATKAGKMPKLDRLSESGIARCLDDSLRRLGTDHIDLYYAHRDDAETPLEESLTAFDSAVRAGKVRHIAASNFSAERLTEALAISRREGLASFVALQNHYNLIERAEYEGAIRDVVTENSLASLPYYGLARGFLTGKYATEAPVDSPRAEAAAAYLDDRGRRILSALRTVAERHDTSMAAVALAWLLAQPSVTTPIASARTVEQLLDLLPLVDIRLTDEDLSALDTASA